MNSARQWTSELGVDRAIPPNPAAWVLPCLASEYQRAGSQRPTHKHDGPPSLISLQIQGPDGLLSVLSAIRPRDSLVKPPRIGQVARPPPHTSIRWVSSSARNDSSSPTQLARALSM